jgi:hypothetical protein
MENTPLPTAINDRPTAAPGKPRRIPEKVRRAVELIAEKKAKGGGMTIIEAAAKVGLSREHLGRELQKPHVAELMLQKVKRALAFAAAHAGQTKIALLDSDSEIVRDRSSSFILGLAGIAPAATPSVALNVEIKAGYIVDLTETDPGPAASMRIVSSSARPAAIDHDEDDDATE